MLEGCGASRSRKIGIRMSDSEVVLCVDLDGTLIRSDLGVESVLALLRRNPLYLLLLPFWLLRGRASLKRAVALRVRLDVARLPYHQRLLEWLGGEQARRRLVLCTASDQRLAEAVARHIGLFSVVHGSDGRRNLSGRAKAALLEREYGAGAFDYAGNAAVDLAVWRRARHAIVVNAPTRVLRRARAAARVSDVFERPAGRGRAWLAALRPHQWLKNALVFVPLLAAHQALVPQAATRSLLAFAAFCLCASAAYLLNDLLDLEADRLHPRKRGRPFAAGALMPGGGLLAAAALAVVAFALAAPLALEFISMLFGYALLTLAYSLWIKRIAMLDVVTLAGLYAIRILAGAAAIPVPASFWLLAFSMFLFFSLALVKRALELQQLAQAGVAQVAGRGYLAADLGLVQALGSASGYLAVLVLALYIDSAASAALYAQPMRLWLLPPILLYWISRTWLLATRGEMHDDPVVFALTDRVSLAVLGAFLLVIWLAL